MVNHFVRSLVSLMVNDCWWWTMNVRWLMVKLHWITDIKSHQITILNPSLLDNFKGMDHLSLTLIIYHWHWTKFIILTLKSPSLDHQIMLNHRFEPLLDNLGIIYHWHWTKFSLGSFSNHIYPWHFGIIYHYHVFKKNKTHFDQITICQSRHPRYSATSHRQKAAGGERHLFWHCYQQGPQCQNKAWTGMVAPTWFNYKHIIYKYNSIWYL